jgi:hypothetical protein
MNRARTRVVLAVVAACSAGLAGTSIASAATPSDRPTHASASTGGTGAAASAADPFPAPAAGDFRAPQPKPVEHESSADQKAPRDNETRQRKSAASRSTTRHRCTPPSRVAGLSRTQTYNARMIVRAGNRLGIGRRGKVVALATALQESGLRNYANANVPASLRLRHEAVGYDHDSVGLFQQRQTWGTTRQLMTPQIAAAKFYHALEHITGWRYLPVTVAAQEVQVSAYPDAYADNKPQAVAITNAIRCT